LLGTLRRGVETLPPWHASRPFPLISYRPIQWELGVPHLADQHERRFVVAKEDVSALRALVPARKRAVQRPSGFRIKDSARERHGLFAVAPSERPVLPSIDPIIRE
jgi:hypothetical protein